MRHSILPNLYLAQTAVMLSGARRVALLLLLTLLTTATAWADNVTLSVDNSIAVGTAGHYFVNMPKTDTKTLTLSEADITTNGKGVFKVYDDGGSGDKYSNGCNGTLVLTAPTGYRFQLCGSIQAERSHGPSFYGPCDKLTVYDGSNNTAVKLIDGVSSAQYGNETAINTVISSGNNMTLYFESDGSTNYAGLDLAVVVFNTNAEKNITVNAATGGTVAASVTKAKFNDVVTLTASPAKDYLLSNVSVVDGIGNAISVEGGWYTNNRSTFTMPATAVTVTPTFTNDLTCDGGLSVNMPKTGTKTVTIPLGVTSFKVYDDGGSGARYSNGCNGTLVLSAPTGYALQLSGSIQTEKNDDILTVYDGGDNTAVKLLDGVSSPYGYSSGKFLPITTVNSSGKNMMLSFSSGDLANFDGLDLTVKVISINIPWRGSGSMGDPYIIEYPSQLDLLAHRVNGTHGETANNFSGAYFVLDADIKYGHTGLDDTDSNYEVIGGYFDSNIRYFAGKFDGHGHTVSGIRIYKGSNGNADKYQGLFGFIANGAEVKNVILADARITGFDRTGGIVGFNEMSTIENCHVLSDVTIHTVQSNTYTHGGIVGENFGTVTGCTSAAALTLADALSNCYYYGGIAGENGTSNSPGTVSQCLYFGTNLNGIKDVGAIVGHNSYGCTMTNNYFTSTTIQGKNISGDALDNVNSAYGHKADYCTVTNCGLARKITLGEGVTLGGTATEHGRVTGYGNFALSYNDDTSTTIYSLAGRVITLGNYSGTTPEGYTLGGYTVMDADNGDVTVTKTSGVYTFTMPAKNVTVSTTFVPDIATYWHADADHDGSEAKPYIISTTTGLDLLAAQVNSGNGYILKYFKLGANIEYDKSKENNFTPIGDSSHSFYGTFDGDGKSISGININIKITSDNTEYKGIFGCLNGTVKNLVVNSSSISARRMIGAIAGKMYRGTIENCHVGNDVTLSGLLYVGGIAGGIEGGTIKGCTCGATITGAKYKYTLTHFLGGIVGATLPSSYASILTDNIFTGAINGNLDENIGAIVGGNDNGTLTNNVYISTGFGGIGAAESTTGADGDGVRQALAISAANGVTLTPVGTATTNNLSGITTYAGNSVMGYGGKFYAGATETVKLTLNYSSVPEGFLFYDGYSDGSGHALTKNADGSYTLTIPSTAPTITPVLKKLLTNAEISIEAIADQIYTGSAFTPAVTVKDGETDITDQCDFAYSDNINVGTATVTITAKTTSTNYTGKTTKTFTIARSMENLFSGSNVWTGYVAEDDLAKPDGLMAYIITALGEETATAKAIDYIPKGEPVLLKRSSTAVNFYLASAGTGTAPTGNLLKAATATSQPTAFRDFVLYQDAFVLVSGGTLATGKVYLPVPQASQSRAASRSIVIDDDGETTNMGEELRVKSEESDDNWYDLSGRKLDGKPAKKGLYIHNGKKVVNK